MVENANGSDFSLGARVMFTGPYGVSEDGAYSEYLAVRKENLSLIPANIDDVSAAGLPVAYLTAHMALSLAGFQPGKTVLAPAIGGSVGNAVTQLAKALGASHAMSTILITGFRDRSGWSPSSAPCSLCRSRCPSRV